MMARGLADHKPDRCLEPLPICIEQRNQYHWYAKMSSGNLDEIVKAQIIIRIENTVITHSRKPKRFVMRNWDLHGRLLAQFTC